MKKEYEMSIRCYFPGIDNKTQHYQAMPLKEIAKMPLKEIAEWIEAYQFTHPNIESITVKVWFKNEKQKL